jgi:hypothetical protein
MSPALAVVVCPGLTALDSIVGLLAALVVLAAVASAPPGDSAPGQDDGMGEHPEMPLGTSASRSSARRSTGPTLTDALRRTAPPPGPAAAPPPQRRRYVGPR